MLNHLQFKHPTDISETPEKVQPSITSFTSSPRMRRNSRTQAEAITKTSFHFL